MKTLFSQFRRFFDWLNTTESYEYPRLPPMMSPTDTEAGSIWAALKQCSDGQLEHSESRLIIHELTRMVRSAGLLRRAIQNSDTRKCVQYAAHTLVDQAFSQALPWPLE